MQCAHWFREKHVWGRSWLNMVEEQVLWDQSWSIEVACDTKTLGKKLA